VFAGLGLALLANRMGSAARLGLPAIALTIAIAQPAMHFRDQDRSRDTQIRDFAKAVLDSLPPGALLMERSDHAHNGLRYMQLIEHYRTDVTVLDEFLLSYPWNERQVQKFFSNVAIPGTRFFPRRDRPGDFGMKALFDANRDRFGIYLCDVALWEDARDTYALWPSGLVDLVLPKPEEPPLTSWMESSRTSLALLDPALLQRYPVDSWEHVVQSYYWKQTGKHGLSLALWAQHHGNDRRALERSATVIEGLLANDPSAPYSLHRDLGAVYQQLSAYDPAFQIQMRQQLETYLRLAPPMDPGLPAVRQILGR